MKKKSAELFKYTPVIDGEGMVFRELSFVSVVSGIFVAMSGELATKDVGFDENLAYQMFYKGNSLDMLVGNVIRFEGNDYNIVHITDFSSVKVIKLNSVIGTKSLRTVVQSIRY